jgi:flavorubredoxin/flavin reductase (DIM6/NTAB) family NADH-FMN oxidoreductase RutF
MVVAAQTTASQSKRLTTQTLEIADNTTALRSLDWDRDRFDIEFGLQNGTTYNSFLIQGEKVALVDTSHEKFRQLYLDALTGAIDPSTLDYLVISHTEPDHSGLVSDVLKLAPKVVVVASKVAIQFLEDLVHQPFERQIVKNGDKLDLGNGHSLEFVMAPNLHWPDTLFSYDAKTGILFTCDAFGMHYCSEDSFDTDLNTIEPDFRFYYECLMAPNARSVLSAMKRMDELPPITTIATGHGPLLRHHLQTLTENYRQWSKVKAKAETLVAVFYVSDYGYSDRLSQAIARGITKTDVAVEMMDLKAIDPQEVNELVSRAQGLVLCTPPSSGSAATSARSALGTLVAAVNGKQTVGLFEAYGGDDEPIDTLVNRLRDLGLTLGFEPIRIKQTPTDRTYQLCEEAGTDLGQLLSRDRKIKAQKSLNSDLEKALGRLSGGLYIITAQRGDVSSAMLASWVSQTSLEPLGFTVAVAKDRAIESLMQVGDRFVLNVLEEGKHLGLMKHFLKRFAPGADRFAGVNTQPASSGAPILTDALAYMDCEVISRMECSDHWLVYSQVTAGRVSNSEGITAVHHRKIGTYY